MRPHRLAVIAALHQRDRAPEAGDGLDMVVPVGHAGEGRAEQRVPPRGTVEGAQEGLDHGLVEPGLLDDGAAEGGAAFGRLGDGLHGGLRCRAGGGHKVVSLVPI
jgi:hypothetical protein